MSLEGSVGVGLGSRRSRVEEPDKNKQTTATGPPTVDLIPAGLSLRLLCDTAPGVGGSAHTLNSESAMTRSFAAIVGLIALTSCRGYHLDRRVTDQNGLVPPDQYARYGREQAEEIAIAREFGRAGDGSSVDQRKRQAEAAVSYARSLPDVAGVRADPQGLLLTVQFRSGWRTMVTPLRDGSGAQTRRDLRRMPAGKPSRIRPPQYTRPATGIPEVSACARSPRRCRTRPRRTSWPPHWFRNVWLPAPR